VVVKKKTENSAAIFLGDTVLQVRKWRNICCFIFSREVYVCL